MTLSWATRASVNIRRTMEQRISRAKGAKLIFRAALKPSDLCDTEPVEREGFEAELVPGPLCLEINNFPLFLNLKRVFSKLVKLLAQKFFS